MPCAKGYENKAEAEITHGETAKTNPNCRKGWPKFTIIGKNKKVARETRTTFVDGERVRNQFAERMSRTV